MKTQPTLLESALEGEDGEAREAAVKAAHDLGITNDDPVWLVVQAIREGDRALIKAVAKLEQALEDTAEKVRKLDERMGMTHVGYETLAVNIRDGLNDIREMADAQWDRCHAGIEQGVQMKRWLVGVAILAIALWALATPRPSEKRDTIPPAEEAVRRDE